MRQKAISSPESATFLLPFSSDQNWCWPHLKEVHRQNRLSPIDTTDFNRFPFNNFTYCLTLFPKCFSSFPHGTCSLSVSRQYLALDETYHPFRAAIPNNSTRWTYIVRWKLWVIYGILTLYDASFQRTYTQVSADSTSLGYNSVTRLGDRFSNWALPASLAVTGGILVSFFSSPY